MVGVPRSSGCRICVQRRVRCDGARPTCNNCRKGNRPCPGYDSGVKFQDEGPKLREKYQKEQSGLGGHRNEHESQSTNLATTPHSVSSESLSAPVTTQDYDALLFDLDNEPVRTQAGMSTFLGDEAGENLSLDLYLPMRRTPIPNNDGSDSAYPRLLDFASMIAATIYSPTAHQTQLLSNFTQSLAPPGVKFMPTALRGQSSWLNQLTPLVGASMLLDCAVRAVTLVHIGRFHAHKECLMESQKYYGKALRCLNQAITDREMGLDNKTLCATILLSFYEMFASDTDSQWIRHAGGAGALMQMRGPRRHRHGFDRDIFLAYRHTLLVEALSLDMPSFLDEPEWRQLSREVYGELLESDVIPANRRSIYDSAEEFYSELATISVLSAKAYRLGLRVANGGSGEDDDIRAVLRQLQQSHNTFQQLFQRWATELTSMGLAPELRPADDPVVPFQYHYVNAFIASFQVGFCTTLIMINCLAYTLANALGEPVQQMMEESREYSIEACRSVDYMLLNTFVGPFFTIYALRFAFRIFPEGDIRSDWALCKLVEIGDRRMQFAKAPVGQVDVNLPARRPESYYHDARQRLDQYRLDYWT